MLSNISKVSIKAIPSSWQRLGRVMPRGGRDEFDSDVTGDPCIVWDEERGCYHMFYFAQHKEGAVEHNRDGHAICPNPIVENIHAWKKLGAVRFIRDGKTVDINTHKPWILMDPFVPGKAARWNGYYWLFTASIRDGIKFIQAAYSLSLDGPWTIDESLDILPGLEGAPDGYHAEAPTAYYFQKEKKILDEFGEWMKINSEAIYGTRPWTIFGEGPIADSDIRINAQGFNEGTYSKASAQDIRFTQTEKYLYATVLSWPDENKVVIKSLAEGGNLYRNRINKVDLLGYGKVAFVQTEEGLEIAIPAGAKRVIIPVFRIKK